MGSLAGSKGEGMAKSRTDKSRLNGSNTTDSSYAQSAVSWTSIRLQRAPPRPTKRGAGSDGEASLLEAIRQHREAKKPHPLARSRSRVMAIGGRASDRRSTSSRTSAATIGDGEVVLDALRPSARIAVRGPMKEINAGQARSLPSAAQRRPLEIPPMPLFGGGGGDLGRALGDIDRPKALTKPVELQPLVAEESRQLEISPHATTWQGFVKTIGKSVFDDSVSFQSGYQPSNSIQAGSATPTVAEASDSGGKADANSSKYIDSANSQTARSAQTGNVIVTTGNSTAKDTGNWGAEGGEDKRDSSRTANVPRPVDTADLKNGIVPFTAGDAAEMASLAAKRLVESGSADSGGVLATTWKSERVPVLGQASDRTTIEKTTAPSATIDAIPRPFAVSKLMREVKKITAVAAVAGGKGPYSVTHLTAEEGGEDIDSSATKSGPRGRFDTAVEVENAPTTSGGSVEQRCRLDTAADFLTVFPDGGFDTAAGSPLRNSKFDADATGPTTAENVRETGFAAVSGELTASGGGEEGFNGMGVVGDGSKIVSEQAGGTLHNWKPGSVKSLIQRFQERGAVAVAPKTTVTSTPTNAPEKAPGRVGRVSRKTAAMAPNSASELARQPAVELETAVRSGVPHTQASTMPEVKGTLNLVGTLDQVREGVKDDKKLLSALKSPPLHRQRGGATVGCRYETGNLVSPPASRLSSPLRQWSRRLQQENKPDAKMTPETVGKGEREGEKKSRPSVRPSSLPLRHVGDSRRDNRLSSIKISPRMRNSSTLGRPPKRDDAAVESLLSPDYPSVLTLQPSSQSAPGFTTKRVAAIISTNTPHFQRPLSIVMPPSPSLSTGEDKATRPEEISSWGGPRPIEPSPLPMRFVGDSPRAPSASSSAELPKVAKRNKTSPSMAPISPAIAPAKSTERTGQGFSSPSYLILGSRPSALPSPREYAFIANKGTMAAAMMTNTPQPMSQSPPLLPIPSPLPSSPRAQKPSGGAPTGRSSRSNGGVPVPGIASPTPPSGEETTAVQTLWSSAGKPTTTSATTTHSPGPATAGDDGDGGQGEIHGSILGKAVASRKSQISSFSGVGVETGTETGVKARMETGMGTSGDSTFAGLRDSTVEQRHSNSHNSALSWSTNEEISPPPPSGLHTDSRRWSPGGRSLSGMDREARGNGGSGSSMSLRDRMRAVALGIAQMGQSGTAMLEVMGRGGGGVDKQGGRRFVVNDSRARRGSKLLPSWRVPLRCAGSGSDLAEKVRDFLASERKVSFAAAFYNMIRVLSHDY